MDLNEPGDLMLTIPMRPMLPRDQLAIASYVRYVLQMSYGYTDNPAIVN